MIKIKKFTEEYSDSLCVYQMVEEEINSFIDNNRHWEPISVQYNERRIDNCGMAGWDVTRVTATVTFKKSKDEKDS